MTPLRPGDVRSAYTGSPWAREHPEYLDKRRPVVLVTEREHGHWHVAGLTKLTTYKNGDARIPVPGWEGAGLDAQPYLWAPRLMWAESRCIEGRTGRATPEMVEAIVSILGLPTEFAAEMLATVS